MKVTSGKSKYNSFHQMCNIYCLFCSDSTSSDPPMTELNAKVLWDDSKEKEENNTAENVISTAHQNTNPNETTQSDPDGTMMVNGKQKVEDKDTPDEEEEQKLLRKGRFQGNMHNNICMKLIFSVGV